MREFVAAIASSLKNGVAPVFLGSREFLEELPLPPIGQAVHLRKLSRQGGIEFEIQATIQCGNRCALMRAFLQEPPVAGFHFPALANAQIKAGAIFANGELDPICTAGAPCLRVTGNARARNLHEGGANSDHIAGTDFSLFDSFKHEIFA